MTAPDPAPVPPVSPVEPQRPDTERLRQDAQWMRDMAFGKASYTKAARLDDAADWIDAQPAPAAPVPATPADERRAVDVRTLPEWDALVRAVESDDRLSTIDYLAGRFAAKSQRVAAAAADLLLAAPLSPPVPKPDDERVGWAIVTDNARGWDLDWDGELHTDRAEADASLAQALVNWNAGLVELRWVVPPAPPAAPPRDGRTS